MAMAKENGGMDSRSLDPAPYFALNGGASDFACATPDKSQGKQDRFRGNDKELGNDKKQAVMWEPAMID